MCILSIHLFYICIIIIIIFTQMDNLIYKRLK